MRGGIRQDAEKKRSGASTIRRKRRREAESGVVWTSGERDVASGRKKRCDVASGGKERCYASQDAQDAQDAEYPVLASGRNAGGSDAESVFADVVFFRYGFGPPGEADITSKCPEGFLESQMRLCASRLPCTTPASQLF